MAEIRREPITRLVRLGGLDLPEVARCIELIGAATPSEGLAAAIHGETEGNPLFVTELVRLLGQEQRLHEAASAPWRASIPQGMREVIAHRLRHLSLDCRTLLTEASVLGREFRLDALRAVSERSGDELLDLLDEALAARVVGDLPTGRGGLRFSHALIRDSLYAELGHRERLRLHRRAAEALEAVYGRVREPHLAELAHHFLEAAPSEVDKAIGYARQAAEHAAAMLAYYVTHLQTWALRRERGGLGDVRESIERYAAQYPTFFIFRCVLVSTYSQLDLGAQARQGLDRLGADGFAGLEVGTEWHFGACLLAEACASLGDPRHAPRIYEALEPYGEYNVMAHPEFSLGSAARYLGLAASTMSRWEAAESHFERALAMNAEMGTRPWLAHSQHDYAAMMLARDEADDRERASGLVGEAGATYRRLGMRHWADKADEMASRLPPPI